MASIAEELKWMFQAGYPLLQLVTHEEERALRLLGEVISGLNLAQRTWSATADSETASPAADAATLLRSLPARGAGVTVALDFHPFLGDPLVLRLLRDVLPLLAKNRHTLLLLSPVLLVPPELERDLAVLELALPTREELGQLLLQQYGKDRSPLTREVAEPMVRAAQGLTEQEASRVFTRALTRSGGLKLEDVALVIEEKKSSIRKVEALEYVELDEHLGHVGGLQEIKRWIQGRSRAFDAEAARYGLPAPKGLLLIGMQGCGKSLMAKAVAGSWKLPLLRLDLGSVLGAAAPDATMHRALTVVQSLAPVVLWLDEIEKGFAGVASGSASGSTRVFGSFITWLQEKRSPVFVVATANEVTDLPPELLRKGRFDETFFVDLPDVHERKAILAIHLARRKRQAQRFDLEVLARQSTHCSGAELEQAVVAGMYRAFGERREVETQDISKELDATVPLYVTCEEKCKALREWARTRARKASTDQSLVDLFQAEDRGKQPRS